MSFISPALTAYTWDMTQHHLNEIRFISVKPIFNTTTLQNVLPHSASSIKTVPSSNQHKRYPISKFFFQKGIFYKGQVSSYFLSLSSSPKSKKADITTSPFTRKLQATSGEAYSTNQYQWERGTGCTGCVGAKPSPGNSLAGLLLSSEGGTKLLQILRG